MARAANEAATAPPNDDGDGEAVHKRAVAAQLRQLALDADQLRARIMDVLNQELSADVEAHVARAHVYGTGLATQLDLAASAAEKEAT